MKRYTPVINENSNGEYPTMQTEFKVLGGADDITRYIERVAFLEGNKIVLEEKVFNLEARITEAAAHLKFVEEDECSIDAWNAVCNAYLWLDEHYDENI